ncbi:DUF2786 domain-containing protein [Alginatibacterium sediminis]|uniref:DUF2786 domain-containing protein n=1 Tax=Alginatibacterium sediminis TaxID=2164068 RepID=A0A420ENG6_9ALTE|nr:DUF2786 domain-containing protein [Alginatibacterium sediminis]RKF22218.1 DUF2786 domain-containing protein [Alginatibacterium sediminis]
MSEIRQKALQKIAKCLELGNSANVHEAAQAIRMAQSLMRKHGLDQTDIELIQMGKTSTQTLLPSDVGQNILRIIRGINSRFGVEAVLVNHKGLKRAEFVGNADRAIFAAFAFDIVYREMNQQVGSFRNSFAGSGTDNLTVSRRTASFTAGWLEGALEKLPDLRSGDRSSHMDDYLDEMFEKLDRETFKAQLKASMAKVTPDFEKGIKKGRKISVSRPVEGARAKAQIGSS